MFSRVTGSYARGIFLRNEGSEYLQWDLVYRLSCTHTLSIGFNSGLNFGKKQGNSTSIRSTILFSFLSQSVHQEFFSSSLHSFQQLTRHALPGPSCYPLCYFLPTPLRVTQLPHPTIPCGVSHNPLFPPWPHIHFVDVQCVIGAMAA